MSTPDRVGGDSDYILTGVGVAAGVVLAVITALVIFSGMITPMYYLNIKQSDLYYYLRTSK